MIEYIKLLCRVWSGSAGDGVFIIYFKVTSIEKSYFDETFTSAEEKYVIFVCTESKQRAFYALHGNYYQTLGGLERLLSAIDEALGSRCYKFPDIVNKTSQLI